MRKRLLFKLHAEVQPNRSPMMLSLCRRFAGGSATRMNLAVTKWHGKIASLKKLQYKSQTSTKFEKQERAEIDLVELLRKQLQGRGWSEETALEKPPHKDVVSKKTLIAYYKQQIALCEVKEKKEREARIRSRRAVILQRVRNKRQAREKNRLKIRERPLKRIESPYRKKEEELQLLQSLNVFRRYVHKSLPDSAASSNQGWPPRDAIFIGKIGPFGRKLFMFNLRTGDGRRYVPILAIFVNNRPVLFLRKQEVLKLQECIPVLRKRSKDGKLLDA